MKKVYERPYAYIENFELSQHIASCTLNVKEQGNILDCYAIYEDGGAKLLNGDRPIIRQVGL